MRQRLRIEDRGSAAGGLGRGSVRATSSVLSPQSFVARCIAHAVQRSYPNAATPLDLDHQTMSRLGHLVADTVAQHLATLREQPAYATLDTAEVEQLIERHAPAQGTDFET